jgi:outer membrane lipoprotein LolB
MALLRLIRHAASAALLLAVAGCAGLSNKRGIDGAPASESFEMAARVAVRYGTDGYTGSLRWRHRNERDSVELYAPVGTLYARLERDARGAWLETADGKRFEDPDAGALSRRVLGWELPLDALPYWVFTRPAPGPAPQRTDVSPEGRPTLLVQGGWQVRYQAYFEDKALVLPERLELERPGLKVKLIVSRWAEPGAWGR